MRSFLTYYITSVIFGLACAVAGVYAFVMVYGWWTFGGMIAIAALLQAWWWFGLAKDEATDLNSAVLRARQAEAARAVRESGEAVDKFINRLK